MGRKAFPPHAPYSAADLCQIVDICGRNRVASFSLGSLKIIFALPTGVDGLTSTLPEDGSYEPSSSGDFESKDGAELAPEISEEIRRNQLLIDDPAAYEQEMIDEKLQG